MARLSNAHLTIASRVPRASRANVRWNTHDTAKRCFAAIAALALATPVATAGAQEYCVDCKSPDAIYRCVIDNAGRPGVPLKMQCMTALAHHGKHASCSIKGGTVFDCNGPIFRLDAGLPASPPATPGASPRPQAVPPTGKSGDKSGVAVPTGPASATTQQNPPEPASAPPKRGPQPANPDGTPRTVEELAKQVTKSSGDSLDKAGGAIADGARKTWNCIATFFKSC